MYNPDIIYNLDKRYGAKFSYRSCVYNDVNESFNTGGGGSRFKPSN
jgi:hypothetical protein